MKRLVIPAAALALTTIVSFSSAEAEMRRGSFEAGAYVFRSNFDDDSNVDDQQGFGGRFGFVFAPRHELEFAFEHISTEDDIFGEDVDLDTFKAGYIFNFLPESAVCPFAQVGGGWQNVDIGAFGVEETDTVLYGGAGIRFFIGKVFNIRMDGLFQQVYAEDDTLLDTLLEIGLGWVFGGR